MSLDIGIGMGMGMGMGKKIIICLNTAWNLLNFRSGLIRALVAAGYEVVAVAPYDDYAPRLEALGCRFVALPMDNRGTHPGRDLLLSWRFWQLFRRERPDVYLGYTAKPNIYGAVAAHLLDVKVINNIAGLGSVFIEGGVLAQLLRFMYRVALKRSHCVFFQNHEDLQQFVVANMVRPDQAVLIPGSGVDLDYFSDAAVSNPGTSKAGFRFLLVGRMLKDKGVVEFVEAARQLRKSHPTAEFCLLGFLDAQNPTALTRDQVQAWVAQGSVNYLGVSDDVRSQLAAADCIVLPSYREGLPRTLLEAAAMGKPIVATDVPGCRSVVVDGENGFLCRPKDAQDLAANMAKMLALPKATRHQMGRAGRLKMEREFGEQVVIGHYLSAIADATRPP